MTANVRSRGTIPKDSGRIGETIKFILIGSVTSIAYWLLESFAHTFIFHTGNFVDNVFTSSPHELWIRSSLILIIWLSLAAGHRHKRKLEESKQSVNITSWKKRLIDEQIEELVVYFDENFDIGWANGAAARSLNMEPQDMVGKKCYELWHNNPSPCKNCPVRKSIDTKAPQQHMITTPDGRFWFIRGYPMIDESGRVTGSFELTLELTALKQAEKKLNDEKERLESILRSVEDGILTTDKLGNITYVNGAFTRITGWTSEEAVGNSIVRFPIVHDKATGKKIIPPISKILLITDSKSINHRGTFKTKEGETKMVSISFSPILAGESEPTGIVAMLKDITEIEERFSHLFESKKLESLDNMASGIANELKLIHQPVLTNLATLKSRLNDNSEFANFVSVLENASNRELKLAEELISLSKGTSPKMEKVLLTAILNETMNAALDNSKCSITNSIENELRPIYADRNQIAYAIKELLKFIKVAARRGCLIKLSAKNSDLEKSNPYNLPQGNYVTITIASDSYFITTDRTDKVFDPYFSQYYTDNGLELAKIRSIVVAHDGFIGVTSLPAKGTSFKIILKAHEEAPKNIASAVADKQNNTKLSDSLRH